MKLKKYIKLIEIGKATEKAYKQGYIMAEVKQIQDPYNENALRVVCHHAFGNIKGLIEILDWEEINETHM